VSVIEVGAVAELVRLPAVLSVPGDVLVGAAACGRLGELPRSVGLVGASSCLYLAGMALNDYADRDVDATERPGRPIPSGRVSPAFALGLAAGLTGAGLGLAVTADGARALRLALPLVASVWGYDLVLKSTIAATASMSACRGLDVLLGAGGAVAALPAAAVVSAHTAVVTAVSRREVQGGDAVVARRALAATSALAAASVGLSTARSRTGCGSFAGSCSRAGGGGSIAGSRSRAGGGGSAAGSRSRVGRVAALGLAVAYVGVVGRGYAQAAAEPSPGRLQRAVGAGVLGLIPLEAGLLAGAGALVPAVGVASLWPLARTLARRRAVT